MTGFGSSFPSRRPLRRERGAALPSPVVLLSIVVVLVAGVTFVATRDADPEPERATTVAQSSTRDGAVDDGAADAAPDLTRVPAPTLEKKPPPVVRDEVIVEVYNNSNVTNLAAQTADTVAGAGWQVVGEDNWVGTIPAPTVYYPERLERAAELLARDLGIERVQPAVEPMRFDRLTVILTASYA